MKESVSGKPLIELLWMAMERGIIRKWSVNGPNVLLHRGSVRFSVPAISAGSFLRQLLIDHEGSTMWNAYRRAENPETLSAPPPPDLNSARPGVSA